MRTRRAIVFVPPVDDYETHAARCMDYIKRMGYFFQGIVRGRYEEVERMLGDGETSVAIVSIREHLNPQIPARVEIVSEEPTAEGPRGRRTRPVKRSEAE
jgi:hypothetical protein